LAVGVVFDLPVEGTGAAIFMSDFIEQDFMERPGDLGFDPSLFKFAANPIERAAAALGERSPRLSTSS
jgi:hypothetical protein